MSSTWTCRGCERSYQDPEQNPELVTGHVADCDYVDGAGNPVPLSVKWSSVHWYHIEITPDELRAAYGGPLPPVEDLLGEWGGDDPLTEYLTELESLAVPAPEIDGVDISDIYPAGRDRFNSKPLSGKDPKSETRVGANTPS